MSEIGFVWKSKADKVTFGLQKRISVCFGQIVRIISNSKIFYARVNDTESASTLQTEEILKEAEGKEGFGPYSVFRNVEAGLFLERIDDSKIRAPTFNPSYGDKVFEATTEDYQLLRLGGDLLLFVEKDAAYVHLEPLSKFFNVNIISGGGWAHTAGIERHLRELKQKGINEVVVFGLGDYDPFGHAIQTEFTSTCEKLGLHVKEYHRIGINPNHATSAILDVQKYPVEKGRKRKLTVNGISFDSDRWLKEYGIAENGTIGNGIYGLEIEAISGQPNGHQHLREIVAQELLKYLEESDRIEELTVKGWNEVSLWAIRNFMNQIDDSYPSKEEITTLPTDLPDKFLTKQEYDDLYETVDAEEDEATSEIDGEISRLEDLLAEKELEKDEIQEPFESKKTDLNTDYECSAKLVMHSLYRYWQEHKEQWPRNKYSLGYPEGCILEAVKHQTGIDSFKEHLDLHEVHDELINTFHEIVKNGEFTDILNRTIEDAAKKIIAEYKAQNNGHDNADVGDSDGDAEP